LLTCSHYPGLSKNNDRTTTRRWPLALFALAAMVAITPAAKADYTFSFSGTGVNGQAISGSGLISVSPTSIPGTDTITGISGTFSDANFNINGAITGLGAVPAFDPTPPFNAPAFTAAGFSYDNLFYPDGLSPIVCADTPIAGGVLDIYGLVFNLADGYTVDLWSNGTGGGYAVGDSQGSNQLEPDVMGAGVPVSLDVAPTPEPNSLILLSTGVLGLICFLGWKRKSSTQLYA
jgi:hypothetical protein